MTVHPRRRHGFFLPILILGVLSVALFIFAVSSLGSNYLNQVVYEEEALRCRVIGESVLTMVLARIRNAPWKDRFFAPTPHRQENQPLFEGTYSLYVLDAPGLTDQVDIYVEARFNRARRLFFWRFKHERSILDAAGRFLPILFTAGENQTIPQTGNVSPLAGTVAAIVAERGRNRERARAKVGALAGVSQLRDVINILDAPPENIILAEDPTRLNPPPPVAAPPTPPPVSPPTVPPPEPPPSSQPPPNGNDGSPPLPPDYVEPTWPPGIKVLSGSGSARMYNGVTYGEAILNLSDGSTVTIVRAKMPQDVKRPGDGTITIFYTDGTSETFPPP
jgi:hypothetical protein